MKRLLIVILFVTILITVCSCKSVKTDINNYDSDRAGIDVGYAASQMPDLDTLGDYIDIKYTYQNKSEFIFESDGFTLFVKYDAEEYENVKNEVLETYTFLEEPIMNYFGEGADYEIPLPEFDYKGYSIRVVTDPYYSDGCKSLSMIGFDDDRCAVVHLYFYDQDLDYIAEKDSNLHDAMTKFMDNSFEWVEI